MMKKGNQEQWHQFNAKHYEIKHTEETGIFAMNKVRRIFIVLIIFSLELNQIYWNEISSAKNVSMVNTNGRS